MYWFQSLYTRQYHKVNAINSNQKELSLEQTILKSKTFGSWNYYVEFLNIMQQHKRYQGRQIKQGLWQQVNFLQLF